MAIHNSSENFRLTDSDSLISNSVLRSTLYDKMARDLDEHGAVFLKGGETSQSLSLTDIFTLKDGSVTPILKAANPPVRANVLYMSPEFSVAISQTVRNIFLPYFDKVIWFQNSSLYHFSMFHASHHITPVPATEDEIEAEVTAVKAVAEVLCPLKIILDRVVLTSTGVLLGCWQVPSVAFSLPSHFRYPVLLPKAVADASWQTKLLRGSAARKLNFPSSPPPKVTIPISPLTGAAARCNDETQSTRGRMSIVSYLGEYGVINMGLNPALDLSSCPLGSPLSTRRPHTMPSWGDGGLTK
ncbi:hypothetical protein HHK36_024747 [Tetracentron sinense]|uniref:Uncharacterized protein n=1 Tax=Tetracentron sinense TaxID=13715 RepID=A0A834YKT9_TETSI|nr:hypothetical protein HHK36_024747 [Tetracentron sinense]